MNGEKTGYKPVAALRADRWAPILAASAAFLAFLPALGNDFVHWDDYANFMENPNLGRLGMAEVRWMLTTFQLAHWQPLSWLSLGVDRLIWGPRPFGHHLTNVLLHCANTVLVCLLVREVLSRSDRDPGPWAPAAGALFFALHPLRAEAVAWATQRREVLSAFFCLLTFLSYLRGRIRAAWGCYLLALFSKVTVIGLPAALVVLDYFPMRRIGQPADWLSKEARPVWKEKLPFALAAFLFAVVGLAAQGSSPALVPWGEYGLLQRVSQAFFGLSFYLVKSAFPAGLSPWYGEAYRTAHQGFALGGFLLAAGVLPAVFVLSRRYRAPLAALAFYAVMLFPALGIVKSGRQIVGDRYSYLPCLCLAAGMGWAAAKLGRRAILPGALVLGILGGWTAGQCRVWAESSSLWKRAVEVEPRSSFAQANLGLALLRADRPREALEYFERQLDSFPEGPQRRFLRYLSALAHNNIGLERAELGLLGPAEEHFRKALAFNPELSRAHDNLGLLLYRAGRRREALARFEEAVRLEPGAAQLRVNLGIALAHLGRRDRAREQFESALKLEPGLPTAAAAMAGLDRPGR